MELLEFDPTVFVYQTPLGLDAICAADGSEDASRLYEFPNGRRLVLPLVRRKGVTSFFTVEKSLGTGGLVCEGTVSSEELRAIFSDLAQRQLFRTRIRPTALAGATWAAAVPLGTSSLPRLAHVLDLEGGFESVWAKRFNGQARRAIRKAERAELHVEHDSTGKLVPVFYELLQRSIDRWSEQSGEPRALARWRAKRRDPIRRFQLLTETLGEACRIWVASVGSRPAAAIVVLQGANAHYTRGAMDKDLAGPTRASFLLQKLAIEYACQSGCRYYNMGETGTSENLARFKSHFGAQAYTFSEYAFERFPITNLQNRLRRVAKKLIQLRPKIRTDQSW